jgi:NAD(P)-dependent dehydrogenase (short-subunit alcohol dehydrogenase family)
MPQSGLADRVIIVTGAGKGLGRAYALHLAASGAAVVVNNRWSDRKQPSSADAVAAQIRAAGGKAVTSYVPAEEPTSGDDMVRLAIDAFGRLDGVIANAGVPEAASFGRESLADFHGVFDINFLGTLHVLHAAWKVMVAQKYGRVVVSTSSAGLHGNRGMPAYSASKAALIGLMRALALEGERADLKANAIAPYAATPMTDKYITPDLAKRMAPEAVAPLAAWLTSADCDVSGQTFVVGSGSVRCAWMVEGPTYTLGEDAGAAAQSAAHTPPPGAFAHANDAFQDFLSRAG